MRTPIAYFSFDLPIRLTENRPQERETDCLQVAIVGVRNPVDDLNISARVRPLLPCLREHNIKHLLQKKQPLQAAFFVWRFGNADTPVFHGDAYSTLSCRSS